MQDIAHTDSDCCVFSQEPVMEKPPPLPPRARDSQRFLEDLERAKTLSLETFREEKRRQAEKGGWHGSKVINTRQ